MQYAKKDYHLYPPEVIYAPQIGGQFNNGPPRPRPPHRIPH